MRKVTSIVLLIFAIALFTKGGMHVATIVTGAFCLFGAGIILTSRDE